MKRNRLSPLCWGGIVSLMVIVAGCQTTEAIDRIMYPDYLVVPIGNVTAGSLHSLRFDDGEELVIEDENTGGSGSYVLGSATTRPLLPVGGYSNWYMYGCDDPYEYDCTDDWLDGNPGWQGDGNTTYIAGDAYENATYYLDSPDFNEELPVIWQYIVVRSVARRYTMALPSSLYGVTVTWSLAGKNYICEPLDMELGASWYVYELVIDGDAIDEVCSVNGYGVEYPPPGWNFTILDALKISHLSRIDGGESAPAVTMGHVRVYGTFQHIWSITTVSFQTMPGAYVPSRLNLDCIADVPYELEVWRAGAWAQVTDDVCSSTTHALEGNEGRDVLVRILSPEDDEYDTIYIDLLTLVTVPIPRPPISTEGAWWIVWLALCAVIVIVPVALWAWLKRRRGSA